MVLESYDCSYIDFKQESTIDFYCPLTLHVKGEEYGELCETDSSLLLDHQYELQEAIHEANLRDRFNMAEYYSGNDEVKEKLLSADWGTRLEGDTLYGWIQVKLIDPLTHGEMNSLKDWITGQNSGWWDEYFEQTPIQTEDGDLYISFWHDKDNYFLYDQWEMDSYLAELQDM